MPREGILIEKPYQRLSDGQIELIHKTSLEILENPGIICFNAEAAELFSNKGAQVKSIQTDGPPCWHLSIPAKLVNEALQSSPKTVVLGARKEENVLIMKGDEARVFFITGSEANIWLDVDFQTYVRKGDSSREVVLPEFLPRRGMLADLCESARVSEHLETLDGFIRNVNIQDKDITEDNKDVNKYFASLNNMTKHFMSGLTNPKRLDDVARMASIVVGGDEALKKNPLISFITCLIKSPLQMVDDTTDTFMAICRKGFPTVVSSSPQAGSSAPMKEDGILSQINAEVLAGITLGQIVNPGCPTIYGSVPVRARLDTLGDSYGAPETAQYNVDCAQLARFYKLPCYATAGVCDAKTPGQQSTVERLFSDILVTLSGPQYLHCAYGLLDCNSVFCLLQAVLDDAHFQMLKFFLKPAIVNNEEAEKTLKQIREVIETPQKLYIKHMRPMIRSGRISQSYPFEGNGDSDEVFHLAYERMKELAARPVEHIDRETTQKLYKEIPGLLPRLNVY